MNPPHGRLRGFVLFVIGTLNLLLFVQAVLEEFALAAAWLSRPTWERLIAGLGGRSDPVSSDSAMLPLFPGLGVAISLVAAVLWVVGAAALPHRDRRLIDRLCIWGDHGWRWWLAPGLWWLLSTVSLIAGWESLGLFLRESCELWLAVALAGWLCAWLGLRRPTNGVDAPVDVLPVGRRLLGKWVVGGAVAAYVVMVTGMNWALWFNLRVPHGDSAMYEEHLWNLEHGKGFRSYLDQGLFLGEHIQVIHVLLVPLHLLWPSHRLLELCQAVVMALGAWPVYRMARRHLSENSEARTLQETGFLTDEARQRSALANAAGFHSRLSPQAAGLRADRAATLLACAYLLYVPLQYLDITIDLKTFRPNSLGVPLLLFALDALEQRRYLRMCGWLALVLACQEDYAIVIGLLGVWIMLTGGASSAEDAPGFMTRLHALLGRAHRSRLLLGIGMLAFGIGYLLLTFKVVLPYFRDGATIHYASYFEKFGGTPGEIVRTMLTQPHRVLAEVFTVGGIIYALRLLVPLGGLPLRSAGRLLTAAPLFALLCLNELAMQVPAPVHHFHAPVVPLLFWAAAAGLCRRSARAMPIFERHNQRLGVFRPDSTGHGAATQLARFACACALFTGLTTTLTPLGLKFWDFGSSRYWRTLYVPDERARAFALVDAMIPQDARVASTDFVHARFTHRERSYDYSDYLREVSEYEERVPIDTDYIVLDIEHPYNTPERIAALRQTPETAVRELREEPDRWELLPDPTNGYYIILRRRP